LHDTNTVRTLIHNDKITITTKDATVKVTSRGEEDEARNREQDYESVSVQGRARNGTQQKLHYTVSIIFLNGQTYYKSSLSHNGWQMHPGTTFQDPFTGGFQRGRTTVPFSPTTKFAQVGHTGSGGTQMHGTFHKSTYSGTEDLWISAGKTPYVVRDEVTYQYTTGGQAKLHRVTTLGPFNRPLNIQAPGIGT
jgi:hypothetical protein